MYKVAVRDHFMIAHSFKGEIFGPAQKLHGATYVVDVEFRRPELDDADIVLIADTENHRVLRYVPKDGTIHLVAGSGRKGTAGLGGDPLRAELNQPHGVIAHPKTGEVYIVDSSNHRILKIER